MQAVDVMEKDVEDVMKWKPMTSCGNLAQEQPKEGASSSQEGILVPCSDSSMRLTKRSHVRARVQEVKGMKSRGGKG